MTSFFERRAIVTGFLLLLVAASVHAQSTDAVPDIGVDARTLRVQEQANEVYERTNYKRAFFIYRNELAPIGDKYAQYMVGFMYLTGKGVEEDPVAASAWYRLAAERGTPEFVKVRDQLMDGLDEHQRGRSDELFLDLRKEIGDLALMIKAVRLDFDKLQQRTGSRVGSGSSPVTVVELEGKAAATARSAGDYYGRIERRMRARLEYIARHTNVDIVDIDVENIDIDALERQVTVYLDEIN